MIGGNRNGFNFLRDFAKSNEQFAYLDEVIMYLINQNLVLSTRQYV